MLLKKLDIVSFGKWNRKTIHLTDGLNLICGPNESGKTSVRLFVTYVLFGLEKDVRERYISKLDGQLGGRIHIVKESDEWVIERFLHRYRGQAVVYQNGERVSDEAVEQFYNGMNRSLFSQIFSFQARDLFSIRNKTAEDIGKVLFNLGLTGSDRIVTLENQLDNKAQKLFKKTGTKPLLNVKINQLKDLAKKIDEVKESEAQHHQLKDQKETIDEELATLQQEKKSLEQKTAHQENVLNLKKYILQYQWLEKELKDDEWVTTFPAEAQRRYDEYKDERRAYQEKMNMHQSRLEQLQNEQEELSKQLAFKSYPISFESIESWLDEAKQQEQTASQLNEQIEELERVFIRITKEAGLSSSPEEILSWKTNQYTEETWKEFANQSESLREKANDIQLKIRKNAEELEGLEQEIHNQKAKILPKEEKLRLQDQRNQLQSDRSIQEHKQRQQEQHREQLSVWKKNESMFQKIQWGIPAVFVLLLALYAGFAFQGEWIDWAFITFFIGMSILGFLVGKSQQQKMAEQQRSVEGEEPTKENEYITEKLQAIELQLAEQTEREKELDKITVKFDALKETEKDLMIDSDHISHLQSGVTQSIEKEKEQFPFLAAVNVQHWPKLMQSIQRAKEQAEQLLDHRKKLVALTKQLEVKRETAQQILSLYRLQEEPGRLWQQVKVQYNLELKNIQRLEQLAVDLEKQTTQMEEEKLRFKPYEDEWQELLTQAGASDEETFLNRLENFQIYTEKQNQKEDAYEFIHQSFSARTDSVLRDNYAWDDLEQTAKEERFRLNEIEERVDYLRHEQAQVATKIKNLEEDGELSDLIHEKSMLIEEINELSKEWAVYRLAYGFLKETKDRYQNVYLPGIMKNTSENFSYLTGGKYSEVQFATESESIMVGNSVDDWYEVGQLSEGTADQLYISLRLALSKSLQAAADLPFLLDDAFVNFDQKRKQHMFELLNEQAKDHQIIYFTCEHQEMTTQAPQVNLIELTTDIKNPDEEEILT